MSAGLATAEVSRRVGLGAGAIIGGRVTLALAPSALTRLAAGRDVVLVSGTNGKTTTSHLLAAALRTASAVAHNASGANMADGAVAALAADRAAPRAVLEVDELHLGRVAAAVEPAVVVLLNLSRDQLDRGTEVRAVAAALGAALTAHPHTTVVANADDPMVVWAARECARIVWVSTGGRWSGDTGSCPQCGRGLHRARGTTGDRRWWCGCGLTRPDPHWTLTGTVAMAGAGAAVPVTVGLPGQVNRANAVTAMATAALLGVDPSRAGAAMAQVRDIAGRYASLPHRGRELRLLLAKNPAGWAETLGVLDPTRPLIVVINAREADGRDTSWLWDVEFEELAAGPVVAAGERCADLGVRLSYAGITHATACDPLAALELLPPGPVDVVANYTAFLQLHRRLHAAAAHPEQTR
ncbi:MAG: MurT ligase domain-containing protein [Pseudonocardia sp.]|nr:MurT ligase domain-containing protein [Pseudonocardia sp.]